jgi:enolase-phosphatase E1
LTTAVVLDIEGTTSATEYVVTTLFPYARARYGDYLAAHRGDERVVRLLDEVRAELHEVGANEPRIVDTLEAWTDTDAKVSALKTLQGWIWQDGFARGDLTAHFFPRRGAGAVPMARRGRHARDLFVGFG